VNEPGIVTSSILLTKEPIIVMKIYLAWLVATLTVAALSGGWAQELSPRLSWHDVNGNVQNLSDYQGKIVVLNFWATWCIPCQHELPILAEMQKKYGNKGVALLGASLDDDKTQGQIEFLAKKDKIRFPLLVGATVDDMRKLNLGETIPATAFLDETGRVVGRVLGELDKSDLQHRIEWRLGNHRGSEPPEFVDARNKKKASHAVAVVGLPR
jgi:thiol-disulfide isomerase/thioredoxin